MANGKTVTVLKKADETILNGEIVNIKSSDDRQWEAIYELQFAFNKLRQDMEKLLL